MVRFELMCSDVIHL